MDTFTVSLARSFYGNVLALVITELPHMKWCDFTSSQRGHDPDFSLHVTLIQGLRKEPQTEVPLPPRSRYTDQTAKL